MELLRIERIEKYYGSKSSLTKAINGISLHVSKGEFVAIMGASGSGKNTSGNGKNASGTGEGVSEPGKGACAG